MFKFKHLFSPKPKKPIQDPPEFFSPNPPDYKSWKYEPNEMQKEMIEINQYQQELYKKVSKGDQTPGLGQPLAATATLAQPLVTTAMHYPYAMHTGVPVMPAVAPYPSNANDSAAARLKQLLDSGVLSPDEVREMLGLEQPKPKPKPEPEPPKPMQLVTNREVDLDEK